MTPISVSPEAADHQAMSPRPSADSELTWLLHRAAQRMHTATGERAEEHGLQLRDYIVLSALNLTTNLTQAELGKALGLDKTTLMSQLDKLERMGLVIRRHDPRDRRARIPHITEAGEKLRAKVARACQRVEEAALPSFTHDEVQLLRRMLIEMIGDSDDPGSCL
ncbi:MarR family winged helix-turn-helix transcriptional regulator [Mycolicibacterium canariasense]|nr:MarR family transcriptional regulator [Mycolicibacterium canariasense]MCV7212827.1 MarR family transcriptional regulator [Mycolicibacterium canariasense]ORV12581.1 transcriptional regulator [Mycolicibacterium canariasense]